jgi:hypothetical protein
MQPLQQICNHRGPGHGGDVWRSNSIPTEHDREVICLGSEHEKDAERRREYAERGSLDVEQSLAKRGSNVCVRHAGKKAERKFEMRLGLVFGEPEKKQHHGC